MAFSVSTKLKKEGVHMVMLQGRLDGNTAPILEAKVMPLITDFTRGIIFDMAQLDYISSAGLRIVFMAAKALKKNQGKFMMTNLQPQVEKVFEIINALPQLQVFQSIEEVDNYLDAMQRKMIEEQES